MKLFLSLLPLVCAAPAPDNATQEPTQSAEALPAAQVLLARYAAATGTPKAHAAIESLRMRGTLEVPGMPAGTTRCEEIHAGGAARQTNTSTFGTMEMEMTMGTTGAWSWSTDPALGILIREGRSGGIVGRLFAAFRSAPVAGRYTTIETVGRSEVEGRACYELRLQPAGGGPETWFLDAETGLLRRYDLALPNPEPGGGFLPMSFLFFDYEPTGGVQIARTREQRVGPMTLTYRFESVEANPEFAPERLAPPAVVQAAFDDPERERGESGEFDPDEVVLEMVEERHIASIRVTMSDQEISSGLAVILPEVWSHLTKIGAEMDGPPLTRTHSHADGKIDIEGGIPVKRPIESAGRVRASTLPAGLTATSWHVGPYTELEASANRLEAWIEANGYETRGGGWAIYWTDPGIEPDPAKWRTQIVYPIAKVEGSEGTRSPGAGSPSAGSPSAGSPSAGSPGAGSPGAGSRGAGSAGGR